MICASCRPAGVRTWASCQSYVIESVLAGKYQKLSVLLAAAAGIVTVCAIQLSPFGSGAVIDPRSAA